MRVPYDQRLPMTGALLTALAGYDIHWWHVAVALVAAAIAAVALFFAARWALPRIRSWSRRRQLLTGAAALLVIAGTAFAVYKALERPGDVLNEDAAFHHTKPERRKQPEAKTVNWPVYGYDDARTRFLPTKTVKPPFKPSDWSFQAGKLLEFSPVIVKNHLYFVDKDAMVYSLDARTGKPTWKRDVGALSAASPAYNSHRIYAVTLTPGQVVALRAHRGRVQWRRQLPGRTETSPIVHGGKVYVGCECGTAYALNKRTGRVVWSRSTGGAIKGGMAYDNGTVFFGNYAGQLYAVDARSGAVRWQSSTQGGGLLSGGGIYSTPAVAYGRVYVGSLDGRVYSFEESSGDLAWSHSTGAEVYPSPAVADTRGSPPTVYAGSQDHHVYALDAKSGALRWEHDVGGVVLGAPSVVGRTVYFAVIGPNIGTFGFRTGSGKLDWKHELGEYNPVISDGERLYLTGSSQVRAFQPMTRRDRKRRRERLRQEERRRERRQGQGDRNGRNGRNGSDQRK